MAKGVAFGMSLLFCLENVILLLDRRFPIILEKDRDKSFL